MLKWCMIKLPPIHHLHELHSNVTLNLMDLFGDSTSKYKYTSLIFHALFFHHINGGAWCISFLLFSLSNLSWRCFHVTPRVLSCFFLQLCSISRSGKMDIIIWPVPIDRCLGCFQYFAITNKAAVYPFIFSVDSSDEFPSRMDGLRKLILWFRQMLTDCSPKGLQWRTSLQSATCKLRPLSAKIYAPLKSSVVLICFPY